MDEKRYCPFMFNNPNENVPLHCLEEKCMAWEPENVKGIKLHQEFAPARCKLIDKQGSE